MAIQLYDSLTRQLQPLTPADGKTFRMYCCGPTVYGPAHIGNFRTFILQDVLRRVLELEGKANGWTVKHVRNLPDVDDKTIRSSQEEGRPLGAVTKEWTDKFQADCTALNLLPPHEQPAATDHIREQVEMIEALLAKGLAYISADGSVYYKIENFPGYGKLSRLKERELMQNAPRRGSTVAADEYERDTLSDFALWKAWKPDDGAVKWPGPKGAAEGRPGWHIECSAMSRRHLGDTLDLHGGGVDLLFPHHENEIAQSEGCTGKTFAHHWWHCEFLLVDGKKMSKSLGNLYTLEDLQGKGFSPMAVRYALLAGHPRKQLNFTLDSVHAAEKAMLSAAKIVEDLGILGGVLYFPEERNTLKAADDGKDWGSFAEAWQLLNDNLNTAACLGSAFTALSALAEKDIHGSLSEAEARVEFFAADRLFGDALGISLDVKTHEEKRSEKEPEAPYPVTLLAEKRWSAKKAKDFVTADKVRAEIQAAGWQMLDGKDGYKLKPAKKLNA